MAAATLQSLLVLTLIIPLPIIAPASSHPPSSIKADEPTCRSVQCVALAAEIASRMNTSADPCSDFYNYACGNFPNVVRYNPLKSASDLSSRSDFLYESTVRLMVEKLDRNIYEMLVLDRVVSSKDADVSELYNFTRIFYRSCRQWMRLHRSERLDADDKKLSAEFLRGAHNHLMQAVRKSSGGTLSMESVLAALMKTGRSFLTVDLPKKFVESVLNLETLENNLTGVTRAIIDLDLSYDNAGGSLLHVVDHFAKAEIGIPWLNFSKKGDVIRPTFLRLLSAVTNSQFSTSCMSNVTFPSDILLTLTQLDELTACASASDAFSWSKLFKELLDSPLDPTAKVEVRNAKLVLQFVTFLKSRPIFDSGPATENQFSDDATLLMFDWLLSYSDFFPTKLRKIPFSKAQAIRIPDGPGVTICQRYTGELLQPIVERMYQRAYHSEDFSDIERIIQLIKNASANSMLRQSWITASGKESILNKMKHMLHTVGILKATQLKNFYRSTLVEFRALKLQPDRLEYNFGSLMSIAIGANAREQFEVMSGRGVVSMLDMPPRLKSLAINAFNQVEENRLVIPMAILETPIYHQSYPEYIKLGSLGVLVGHEIGHSFDNWGHYINHERKTIRMWDKVTDEAFHQRMECIRSRYGNYSLYPGGPLLKSNESLGEDIADAISISAATEALKMLKIRRHPMPRLPNLDTAFSPEQLLFIQAAQNFCMKIEPYVMVEHRWSHSPGHLRIRGMAENSEAFSDAFKCPRDAPMNPKLKCTFW